VGFDLPQSADKRPLMGISWYKRVVYVNGLRFEGALLRTPPENAEVTHLLLPLAVHFNLFHI